MSVPDFIQLAHELLSDAMASSANFNAGHEGLIGLHDQDGTLEGALSDLEDGDLLGALERLDKSIKLASQAPEKPTTGRNQASRHQCAIRERHHLHTVAQVCRVLVLKAILTTP